MTYRVSSKWKYKRRYPLRYEDSVEFDWYRNVLKSVNFKDASESEIKSENLDKEQS